MPGLDLSSDLFLVCDFGMARPEGFEPPTTWFVARWSIFKLLIINNFKTERPLQIVQLSITKHNSLPRNPTSVVWLYYSEKIVDNCQQRAIIKIISQETING